jgi:NAD-dependent SIR2 family protein deacetylase
MKKKNVVFILGAGASKDFGLPLGNEIFDYTYKILMLKKDSVVNELKTVWKEVEKNMKYIFVNLPNDKIAYPPFEEVLTFIWDCRKSETWDYKKKRLNSLFKNKNGAKSVFDVFVKMLGLTIAGSMLFYLPATDVEAFKTFIKSLDFDKKNISFISLNYDVLIDNILHECVKENIISDYTYGVPLSDISDKYNRYSHDIKLCRRSGIPLLKPHGSLNLIYCSHHQARYGDGFYYSKNDFIAIKNRTLNCPGCGGSMAKPLIIPPLYNKSDYVEETAIKMPAVNARSTPELYRRYLDYKIKDVLKNVDEIIVLGYSMPSYDYDFRSLLMSNLMLNKKRKEIHLKVVTKSDSSQIDNLTAQYKCLVGTVTVEGDKGLYKYLKDTGTHRIIS